MACWESRIGTGLDSEHRIPRKICPLENPANILLIVHWKNSKIIPNLVGHAGWKLQNNVTLLRFAFSSQELVADDDSLLDILAKSGTSRVRVHYNINARLCFGVPLSSKGCPKLLVLPLVKVIEDVTCTNIAKADICDSGSPALLKGRVQQVWNPMEC